LVQLGCGITGLVCAEHLSKNSRVDEVVLADARTDAAEAMAARVKSDKFSVKKVDSTKNTDLKKLLKGSDLVISSLPWLLNKRVLETAASLGIDYVDFCLTINKIEEYEPMAKMVKDSGITALTSTGEDPGISDCFARAGANMLDEAFETRTMDGDSGSAEGYDFFSLWSPIDLLEETTVPAAVFRDGKMTFVPPLHEKEYYDFPAPLGRLPVYKTNHEETYLMPKFIKGVRNADFRIAIDDGWAAAARMIKKLGMHSLEPIDVKGVKVRPIDVVVATMPRPVDLIGKVKGMAAIVVEVYGMKNGQKTMVKQWTMMSHEKAYQLCRSNATGYLVGTGGAAAAELLIEGEIKDKGYLVPEQLPAEKLLARLPAKGLEVMKEVKTL
jgi:saccharopine dehydrogenase-like NADP-dependent oxidoreductase